MTRVIDKRNVCIVAKNSTGEDSRAYLVKRGSIIQVAYGKFDDKIEILSGGTFVEHMTTPDMLVVVNPSYPAGNANVKAYFNNGVEARASEIEIGGDTYKVWGLKSQDFVVLDFSMATA